MTLSTGLSRRTVLLETLVAVAVFALAMNFLVRFAITGARDTARVQNKAVAALLAQEKMEEIIRARHDISAWMRNAEKKYPFDSDSDYRFFNSPGLDSFRWRWRFDVFDGDLGLYEVTVRVVWDLPGGSRRTNRVELAALMTFVSGVPGGGL